MRKQTKTSITKKLDKICSDIVRARGHCERCGPLVWHDYSYLQCHHLYSRTYRSVRWDFLNLVCFCKGCHAWWHHNPTKGVDWAQDHLGENYTILRTRAHSIKQWKLIEMIELYESLKSSTGNLRA